METFDPSSLGRKVKNVVGVVSIKDIFEDIMQEELIDEDVHLDSTPINDNQLRKRNSNLKHVELKNKNNDMSETLI